jgi:hypothetical protein
MPLILPRASGNPGLGGAGAGTPLQGRVHDSTSSIRRSIHTACTGACSASPAACAALSITAGSGKAGPGPASPVAEGLGPGSRQSVIAGGRSHASHAAATESGAEHRSPARAGGALDATIASGPSPQAPIQRAGSPSGGPWHPPQPTSRPRGRPHENPAGPSRGAFSPGRGDHACRTSGPVGGRRGRAAWGEHRHGATRPARGTGVDRPTPAGRLRPNPGPGRPVPAAVAAPPHRAPHPARPGAGPPGSGPDPRPRCAPARSER